MEINVHQCIVLLHALQVEHSHCKFRKGSRNDVVVRQVLIYSLPLMLGNQLEGYLPGDEFVAVPDVIQRNNQVLPGGGVPDLEYGDVDGNGIIEGELLHERSLDIRIVLVLPIDLAALVQRQLARMKEYRRAECQAGKGNGKGYIVSSFHSLRILLVVVITFS